MYQIGELIVYGSTGVCRVKEVRKREDGPGQVYVLEPLYQDCRIITPVDNEQVRMRPILSHEEAEALIDSIPGITAVAYHNRVLRELETHYRTVIKNYDCGELLQLTMSIYAKKQEMEQQKRKFGAVDERFLKQGEYLVFGELAASLGIPREDVPAYIQGRVEGQAERQNEEPQEKDPA